MRRWPIWICALVTISLLGCIPSVQLLELPHSSTEPTPTTFYPVAFVAEPEEKEEPTTFERDVVPMLNQFCMKCHNGEKPRGGIRFDTFKDQPSALKQPKVWEKVAENLRGGVMPPEGRPRPSTKQLDRFNLWLDTVVFKVDCNGQRNPGRVTVRRLNRTEYNNTIRDLLGIDFEPAKDFPADDVGYGFDNIGDVLSLPPLLLEKYLAASEAIVKKVFATPEAKRRLLNPSRTQRNKNDRRSRRILRHFAERAYRRPLHDGELDRLSRFLRLALDNGDGYEEGIQLAMQAVLVSPNFLFRIEMDPKPGAVRTIDDFELATRLSYFLWASMPDEELFAKAHERKLHDPKILEQQVRRMLKDPKAKTLSENFASQWLTIRSLEDFVPDPKRFPTFNDQLREAMLGETQEFFAYIVREDRNILELLDADYTFVNESLAKHYGIPGVKGNHFRKVQYPNDLRGGILTHASVLTVTSNPTRTSPVKRGKWILETILGTPPPPPPPNVEELAEGEQAELRGSLRERMEQHRSDPNCAVCHTQMDALGFAFENFDVIGAWRTHEHKHRIDPSGELPGGLKFQGPTELRTILKNRKDDFARTFAQNLLTYALGRGLERTDKCFVDDIVASVAKQDYRFSSFVLEIVNSDPFLQRRGKGDK